MRRTASKQLVEKNRRVSGFTLVELSIVLVIIGLLVGAILVGNNLVLASRIRSAIAQVDSYESTVYAFRERYNAVPGDFRLATDFGLGANGDGDGRIEDSSTQYDFFDFEIASFWPHLVAAGFINGPYDGSGDVVGEDFPTFELGKNGIIAISAHNIGNFYGLGVQNGGLVIGRAMTPFESFSIDNKVDDGYPSSGRYLSLGYITGECTIKYLANIADFNDIFENSNQCNQAPSTLGCILDGRTYNLSFQDNVCGAVKRAGW